MPLNLPVPNQADLYVYQGDDFGAMVTVLNEDGTEADITGYTARAQIRPDIADLANVSAEITTVVSSPYVNLSLLHDQTVELCGGRYVWDLELTSPANAITTALAGKVFVTAEVTREEVLAHGQRQR
jgi:hypothetical protein